VTLLRFLPAIAVVALAFTANEIFHVFRARAMRAFAAKWGLQYSGPAAPKRWNPSHHHKISPPLPSWFSLACHPSGRQITQVWNVIEGHQNGMSVLIFDSILGAGRGDAPCTVIACESEQNPFGIVTSPDRIIQSGGWTAVHGVWFLWFSWTMGIGRIDSYVKTLSVGASPQS